MFLWDMRALLFIVGVLTLLVPEILRVYYIMPFPGSQADEPTGLQQVRIAYWLHHNIWWIRLIGLALAIGPFVYYLRRGGWGKRVAVLLPAALCALVYYAFNFKFMADKMFLPATVKIMASSPGTFSQGEGESLVIAVEHNGDARAYPIELIGYHHQIMDTVGGAPVMVTYCTVCRTGRAWKPEVDGKAETFRLVGMDHFNAMFEDSRTKSWWRQATGECIVGPLAGAHLQEMPSAQYTLADFAQQHPNGLVFQPDPRFAADYAALNGFDEGTIESGLEYRDTASWQMKSWVVGIEIGNIARAYDWNDLSALGSIEDTLDGKLIRLMLKSDDAGFMADSVVTWIHTSQIDPSLLKMGGIDTIALAQETSFFPIPAYQEFWHSWRTFHPNTTRYEPKPR